MKDQPLFPTPKSPPLARPKARPRGIGPVKYDKYAANRRCQDCELATYERLMEGRLDSLPIRRARFKRSQGDEITLLCAEHRADRELEESAPVVARRP